MIGASGSRALSAMGRKIIRSQKINKYLELLNSPLENRYKGISSYEDSIKNSLYHEDFRDAALKGNDRQMQFLQNLFDKSRNWDPLSRMLYFDTKTWLVDDLLIKADRMSMATSIELRVPFLDHRLVEYAASLPSKFKLHGTNVKHILKKVLADRLPKEIINRKKMGFPTPLEMMFKNDLFPYAYEMLLSQKSNSRGYFKSSAIKKMLEDHRRGVAAAGRYAWRRSDAHRPAGGGAVGDGDSVGAGGRAFPGDPGVDVRLAQGLCGGAGTQPAGAGRRTGPGRPGRRPVAIDRAAGIG